MNAQQLRRALDELEAKRVPPNVDLWPRLRARIDAQPRGVRRGRSLRVTRLGWVALALAGLLAVGATARAAAPAIGRLLKLYEHETMRSDDPASLGQQLHLSQTIGGVTVLLEWAYADPNRVLVGYTVRSSDGRRFAPRNMTLVREAGAPLEFTMAYGVTGESEDLDVALPPGEGSYVGVWNTLRNPQSPAPPETLKLRLELEVEELLLPAPAGAPAAAPAGPGSVLPEPLPAGEWLGPFTFEFSIPVMGSS